LCPAVDVRRQIAWTLRIDECLSLSSIVERLKRDHGISVSTATVSRDLDRARSTAAKTFGSNFDPLAKIAEYVARYESLASRAIRASEAVTEPSQKAALLKVAGAMLERSMTLMQDNGLVHRDLGLLRVDDPRPVQRIPSGIELQALYDSINVTRAEITSEAEIAWLYGDQAAAEDASTHVVKSEAELAYRYGHAAAAARDARDSGK
jgi:hypothetical protein